MSKPSVAVIGASTDRSKYGNKSVRAHVQQGYAVFPVHPKAETIEGLTAYASLAEIPVDRLDRVTVYVPPQIGITLLDEIQAKRPGEVWFNPGSESPELIAAAEERGLNSIQACSIVDIGASPAAFPGE